MATGRPQKTPDRAKKTTDDATSRPKGVTERHNFNRGFHGFARIAT